jgi:PBP1b-binding outer membrane lipoprotein LpoB
MTPLRCTVIGSLTAMALLAAGCSLADPYATPTPTPPATTPTPTARPSASSHSAPARRADQAVDRFVTTFINWRFDRLPTVKRRLAAQATGRLRHQLLDEVQQALSEVSRRESNQSNHGSVKVISNSVHGGRFLVVTHETAKLGNAAGQSGYFVYRATATRVGAGFLISDFQATN